MVWLLIWATSIVINVIVVLIFTKKIKKDGCGITYCDLFYLFTLGIVLAPLSATYALFGMIIKLHNKISNMDTMNKVVYKFKQPKL